MKADSPGRGAARERILAATIGLIAEGGIDSVTHRAVASRAKVSPGSTTHHFTSREDLLRGAFGYYLHQLEELIRTLEAPTIGQVVEPSERVRQVLCGLVEREFQEHGLVRAEYELLLFASTDPELAADVRLWESRMVTDLAAALERAGNTRPIESARTLVNLVRGYELERLINPRLTTDDFQQRLGPIITALCANRP